MTETDFFEPYPASIQKLYSRFASSLKKIGPFTVEIKKTSLHLVNAKGFAGVHPKQSYLGINLVLARKGTTPKADTVEQVSANRFHHLFKLSAPDQINADFLVLVQEAYRLMGEKTAR